MGSRRVATCSRACTPSRYIGSDLRDCGRSLKGLLGASETVIKGRWAAGLRAYWLLNSGSNLSLSRLWIYQLLFCLPGDFRKL
jgi:hypothetical protein